MTSDVHTEHKQEEKATRQGKGHGKHLEDRRTREDCPEEVK